MFFTAVGQTALPSLVTCYLYTIVFPLHGSHLLPPGHQFIGQKCYLPSSPFEQSMRVRNRVGLGFGIRARQAT